jgi:hypothetical protein
MKKITFILLLILIKLNDSFAQDIVKIPIIDTSPTGEANWNSLPINAKNIYSRIDVADWPLYKFKQTIFLCTKSFKILENKDACTLSPETINIAELNKQRLPDKKAIVYIKVETCNVKLELISEKELEENFNTIEIEK